jgi:pilus assembly protein CpaB
MKRFIPLLLALVVFIIALFILQPESKITVGVLVFDLPAGHVLTIDDLEPREIPASMAPADAVTSSAEAVGQTLKIDRSAGDVLRLSQLGEPMSLQPGERAVAIRVDDASGLGGMLAPGDMVGLTAVLSDGRSVFSKVTVEGIRVLYVSPEFRAGYLSVAASSTTEGAVMVSGDRSSDGTVILAVPVDLMDVRYDFTSSGGSMETRKVNAVELISALSASGQSGIMLYLVPENPEPMDSAGLYLPDLVLMPTPTPESMPVQPDMGE